MALAGIIAHDEDALVCDLAEAYGILDYRALPARLLATLTAGLRENARVRSGKIRTDTALMAAAVDRLSYLVWAQTRAAQKGRGRPGSVLSALLAETQRETAAFETAQEYEDAWEAITGVRHGGR